MAKPVKEEVKKAVKDAVIKAAVQAASNKPVQPLPEKKPQVKQMGAPSSVSEKYVKPQEATSSVKKEVKDSIENLVSGQPNPLDQDKKELDAVVESAAPKTKSVDAIAQEQSQAYQSKPSSPQSQDPSSFYRSLTSSPSDPSSDTRSLYQTASRPVDDNAPGRSYALKDSYQRKNDAQGQNTDVFGNQELSLSGRIQKLYSKS